MSKFKCIRSFFRKRDLYRDSIPIEYRDGQYIDSTEYYNLAPSDQLNFVRANDSDYDGSNYSTTTSDENIFIPPMDDTGSSYDSGSSYDDSGSSSTPDSSDSSFDFGGGDSGGGGASGDW